MMRMPYYRLSAKLLICSLFTLLLVNCKKSDKVTTPPPAISYKQKVISIAEDVAMTPVKPDSTGGPIAEYTINPLLPKGLSLNTANGEISGTPSDTLLPTKFVVTARGTGGTASDTITMLVGTVGFNYGPTGVFTFEKDSKDLITTAIAPMVLAGNFNQYFCSPSPDSLNFKTGLVFNAKTGQISGTPTKLTNTLNTEIPTPVSFVITGITTNNKAASTTISIIVNDKKPAFLYTFNGTFTKDLSIGSTLNPTVLTTSGLIKRYRLAPGSPALPAGLTLDSTSGSITGTPTAAANVTVVVRGLNTGGYQDVNVRMVVNATAIPSQVSYMMSLFNGNLIDTLCPRINSGNTIYLTKLPTETLAGANVYLNPLITAGQVSGYSVAATPFVTGESLNINSTSGVISGTPPGNFSGGATPSHTVTLTNPAGIAYNGSFTMNIVANDPFFTYNSTGKGTNATNNYLFVQNQPVNVASSPYPGYTSAELSPVNGAGVVSYSVIALNPDRNPFAPGTGLTLNTTTGVISGTPTINTYNFNSHAFYDCVVVGKKADGSFTLYKLRIKIYRTLAEWSLL
ncbi:MULTISPECIES: putative Ig domain-containing protein [Niastella]|uniref:Ig domain-containing protein n=1 Tax=Niastella soli TaxID=2821487 RepID=A0ABS3Z163_9BACT|nr:putative Ig domain-containing protein [Niastella soli]MBO9203911.1 putative Ig domain-containing protein [Niastella soli]